MARQRVLLAKRRNAELETPCEWLYPKQYQQVLTSEGSPLPYI